MKLKLGRLPLLLALCLAVLLGFQAASSAHATVTLSVAPSLLELEAAPGNTGEQIIQVTNGGDEPFSITTNIKDYPRATPELSAKDWLQITPATFELKPGEKQAVKVSMRVPRELRSGGHYAIVAFRTGPKGAAPGSGAAFAGEVGVPLLFTVKSAEPVVKQAAVSRILPSVMPDGTVGFQVVLANQGNVHFFPQGKLEVRRADGTTVETLRVPESTAIIPGPERVIDATGRLPLPPGRYTARVSLDYGGANPTTHELTFSPLAKLTVQALSATEQPGKAPLLRLLLANEGEMMVVPQVTLDVLDGAGKTLGSASPAHPKSVAPGQQTEITSEYPGSLGPGEYSLRARVTYGSGQPLDHTTAFRLGQPAAAPDPAWGAVPAAQPAQAAAPAANQPLAPTTNAEAPTAMPGWFFPAMAGMMLVVTLSVLATGVTLMRRRSRSGV